MSQVFYIGANKMEYLNLEDAQNYGGGCIGTRTVSNEFTPFNYNPPQYDKDGYELVRKEDVQSKPIEVSIEPQIPVKTNFITDFEGLTKEQTKEIAKSEGLIIKNEGKDKIVEKILANRKSKEIL